MNNKYQDDIATHFVSNNYIKYKPFNIVNNKDTVFVTAGIQPLMESYINDDLEKNTRLYIAQPVIRTQFIDTVKEGNAIGFVNLTTASFNSSYEEYNKMINDWLCLFEKLGMKMDFLKTRNRNYSREWGKYLVNGIQTFYYYKDVEIGDGSFISEVQCQSKEIKIQSIIDVGFGYERLKWLINSGSFFDLECDSSILKPEVKAYISSMMLLLLNGVKPSNKSFGYRFRLLSKKLTMLLERKQLNEEEISYLNQSLNYWKNWYETNEDVNMQIFNNEYFRNYNRIVLDKLQEEGYTNINNININLDEDEFVKRLNSSMVPKEKIKKYYR